MRKTTMILWITHNYNGFECARIPGRHRRPRWRNGKGSWHTC